MDDELNGLIAQWRSWDKNETTLGQLDCLVESGEFSKIRKLLGEKMTFGTAGLRAEMGVGSCRMNDVTVIQAAQGLAAYMTKQFERRQLSEQGVVIGYDGRHNSFRFARLSANVFLSRGIKTFLFSRMVPTPFVPFTIRRNRCIAGVMVTASHNPKNDNGYKVYWSNGAQIIPPHDEGIAKCIEEEATPLESSWHCVQNPQCPYEEINPAFFASLKDICIASEANAKSQLKFTYTAMHGVGAPFAREALSCFGFSEACFVPVEEQVVPDPEFPTVDFPNPEEGKTSLDLAFQTAEREGSTIILANDPDADRLAVAEKCASQWKVFTGNEIGALLGWWIIRREKSKGTNMENSFMISSAVSSKILQTMAKKEGYYFEETLTGFKWMGSRAAQLEAEGKNPLFAYEEAIGFMIGNRVLDKDGITAVAIMAEMCQALYAEGLTLRGKLDQIFEEHGLHCSYNSYYISRNADRTREMFDTMRSLENGDYPTTIDGVAVRSYRDLSTGIDTSMGDKKARLPLSKGSPMVTFNFQNGISLTIRGSGTEPKVKWYSELISSDKSHSPQPHLREFVDKAVAVLMRPEQFGFIPRST